MTPLDYLTYFFCGLLGILFMVLIKLKALKTRTEVANEKFNVITYFKDDYITLLLSLVTVLIALVTVKAAVHYKPGLSDWLYAIFVGVGYMGTSILTAFFSRAEERINKVIDTKTDIADGK